MKTRYIGTIAIVVIVVLAVCGAYALNYNSNHDNAENDTAGKTITDFAGRQVKVPENLDKGVITVGKLSTLRMLSYFPEAFNKVKMVDAVIKSNVTNAASGQLYGYIDSMKAVVASASVHETDDISSADYEAIGKIEPSLILVNDTTYSSCKTTCDELAKFYTLFVVDSMGHYDYSSYWNDDLILNSDFKECFYQYGRILNMTARAEEIVDGMKKAVDDVKGIIKSHSDKSFYVTGVSYLGINDMLAAFPNYISLMMAKGTNATSESVATADRIRTQLASAEDLSKLRITDVVLDPSGYPKMKSKNTQLALEYFYGLNNDTISSNDVAIHVMTPLVAFGSNWELVIVNAYYLANVCYGAGLSQAQLDAEAKSVLDIFFKGNGGIVFDNLVEFYSSASPENTLAPLHQVKIVKNGDFYSLGEA